MKNINKMNNKEEEALTWMENVNEDVFKLAYKLLSKDYIELKQRVDTMESQFAEITTYFNIKMSEDKLPIIKRDCIMKHIFKLIDKHQNSEIAITDFKDELEELMGEPVTTQKIKPIIEGMGYTIRKVKGVRKYNFAI